ncbi:MAG: SAM-dependent methyltransferase [Halieaceae bacterium]
MSQKANYSKIPAEKLMSERNLDQEFEDSKDRDYIYEFDRIMHRYLLKKFSSAGTFTGSALEMGCFEGNFTELLLEYFPTLTVIEGSADLAERTAQRFESLGRPITMICDFFERANPTEKYDNIFLIHSLEHVDDTSTVLSRAKSWLSDSGRLYIACPNANAPSRQIAVKMGLIDHNAAVTPAEYEHGHRRTYSLDTLERDAKSVGLEILGRGGVMFKGLANFQMDAALAAGIIDASYLEGCYALGDVYPDLCSSVYVVCHNA